MAIINPPPPGYMKMASGRIVPAQASFGMQKQKPRRFLLVLQFYDGDLDAAEQLASLISDLERTRNRDTDILLFRRADCREMSAAIVAKLKSKFDTVQLMACRRSDARSHPHGPNQMWSDLLMLMAQNPPFATDYYAFVNLEADATPTRPGWIGELNTEWRIAQAEGKSVIGFIHNNPITHMNGVAVWSSDTFRRAGGNVLAGGSPQIAYDIRHAKTILPMSKDTPLIYFEYRKPTITPAELFAPRKSGIVPALWHGVKDGSARAAVRARHITFTDKAAAKHVDVLDDTFIQAQTEGIFNVEKEVETAVETKPPMESVTFARSTGTPETTAPTKRPNVYTYAGTASGANKAEQSAILDAWRKGWSTRGWNPVVLTLRDAAKHPRFDEMAIAIEKLPYVGDRKKMTNSFNRWLALDMVGGGRMVDNNTLPLTSSPESLGQIVWGHDGLLSLAFDKEEATAFVASLIAYDAKPEDVLNGKPHVTDEIIATDAFGINQAWESNTQLKRIIPEGTGRTSVAMERFLSEVPV